MKISKCVGIDLGTTNSVIAMVGNDNKTIICRTDGAGRKTFPSAVVYDARSNALKSGQVAFNRRGNTPEPIISIKSHMGDGKYTATTGPKTLTPIEVSAEVLGEMKRQMEEQLHKTPEYADYIVNRAVITIPAYFASNAREATTKAGELAGLKVEFTLQEPTSSALYYCHKNDIDNGIFMVYDLGGGTFDVSVVRIHEGDAFVLGIGGNNYLGGDNFDAALAELLLGQLRKDPLALAKLHDTSAPNLAKVRELVIEGKYEEEKGPEVIPAVDDSDFDYDYVLDEDTYKDPENRRRFEKLKLFAENIKKALTGNEEHFEEINNIFSDKENSVVNLAVSVHRNVFDKLILDMLCTTVTECTRALDEAKEKHGVTLDMIDGVLMVGGSTHVPLVSKVITAAFTDPSLPLHTKRAEPLRDEPDMAVGYGAAIAAAGCGTITVDDEAAALLSGDEEAAAAADGKLVLSPEFKPGAGYGGLCNVEGKLTALSGTLPSALFARVKRAAGGFQKEYPVMPTGEFAFVELPSTEDSEPYACEFVSGGTTLLQTTFDAAIRNARKVSIVLSRDYFLETLNENTGELVMTPLMKSGDELPLSREYTFSTNSNNQHFAVLRFFEENDFLKQVTMTFDKPVPPGTKIQLSLSCNLQSKFAARATAGGVVVDTEFESSDIGSGDGGDPILDLETQIQQARERIAMIPEAGKKIVAEKQLDRLSKEIERSIDEDDHGKTRDRMNDLKKIGGDAKPQAQLSPPIDEFESTVRSLLQLNETSKKGSPKIGEDIRRQADLGRKAFAENQQRAYSQVLSDLAVIHSSLQEEAPKPPKWMICHHFATQCLEFIDTVEQRDDLPASYYKMCMADAANDRSELRAVLSATRYQPGDDECQPHMQVIGKLHPKWEERVKVVGTPKV